MSNNYFSSYHTYKEIFRVGELVEEVDKIEPLKFDKRKKYIFIGCGSSYNIGLITKSVLNNLDFQAEAVTSGEFLVKEGLFERISQKYDVAILISRTGTTTETVEVANILKSKIKTIGITCEKHSPLTSICDEKYEFDFAHEESIVMTSSFSVILRFLLNGIYGVENKIIKPSKFLETYDKLTTNEIINSKEHFVFLGYNEKYFIAKESALKIEEMALTNTEFYETLEYRHGPIALLTEKTHVTIFSDGSKYEKDLFEELKRKGASVHMLEPITEKSVLEVQFLSLYAQILGFKKALAKGINPDRPKGLVKSVVLRGD
ncbi:MAG: SIS domain-containing protein [Fervidobacterium nodosum]